MTDAETVVAEEQLPEVTPPQEEKEGAVAPPEKTELTPEDELDGFEEVNDERGKIKLTLGNSVYFGNSKKDAWAKAREAEVKKDEAFRELKAKQSIRVPEKFTAKDVKDDLIEFPDEQEILNAKLRKAGIDPRFASMTDQEWIKFRDDNGYDVLQINRWQQQVDRIKEQANKEFIDENNRAVNFHAIKRSQVAVQKMLVKAGLDPDEFGDDYHAVLEQVWSDPTARDAYGIISDGIIVAEMFSKILPRLTPKQVTKIEEKIRSEQEKAKELKKDIRSAAPGTKAKLTPQAKSYVTLKEATAALKERMKAGGI